MSLRLDAGSAITALPIKLRSAEKLLAKDLLKDLTQMLRVTSRVLTIWLACVTWWFLVNL